MKAFQSFEAIQNASVEELKKVPAMIKSVLIGTAIALLLALLLALDELLYA